MNKDNLGDRMKGYENINRYYLTRRMPCIIRVDGKAFHSFTKGFDRPFDHILNKSMQETAKYLCEKIEGCKLAYGQSDEISLLLTDYDNLNTCAWFDKNIQKIVSVSASLATLGFNKNYRFWQGGSSKLVYGNRLDQALFDSRVFVIPKEEVCNYFIWRQQDATRNAIQMVGQANFSHKQMHSWNCNQIQEELFTQKGINFNDYPVHQKRGYCVIKEEYEKDNAKRTCWVVDNQIPIFTQDRNYIEKFIYIDN